MSENSAKKGEKVDSNAALNIARSIRASIICGAFQGLVVVDSRKKPIGFFAREQFLELLRLPLIEYGVMTSGAEPEKLYESVMASELGPVLTFPEIRAKSDEARKVIVSWSDNLDQAYKKIIGSGSNVAMIVDKFGRFDGIITRSAIESRVIGKLIETAR